MDSLKVADAEARVPTFPAALDIPRLGRFNRLALPFSERRAVLMTLDLVALSVALVLTLYVRPDIELAWHALVERPWWFVLLGLVWLPLAFAVDAYDLQVARRMPANAVAMLKAGLIATVVYQLIPLVTPPLPPSRLGLVTLPLLAVLLLVAGRGLYVLVLGQPMFQRRVLVVGAGWAGVTILHSLAAHGAGAFRVVGFVDDDPEKQGTTVDLTRDSHMSGSNGAAARVDAWPVLGDRQALQRLIAQYHVTTLVLAITHDLDGDMLQALIDCLGLGVEIFPMPVLYEQLTGRVPIEHVGDNWHVAMPIFHRGTGTAWPLVKRCMDIVLASLGLALLACALPLIALAIYLDSPGPIFYTQERVGKGGRRFRLYKLRSMVPDAERGQAVWASRNDHRITRVGRFLRRTHLDEFPQFLNIVRGEMSAVGPRPERPEFVDELAREIPFYRVRNAVRPGMAGWGLVKQGYGSSKEDSLVKLQYDLYYVKHQSPWLDVVILLKTILDTVMLRGR